LVTGTSYTAVVAERILGLSRYWDSRLIGAGYDSVPLPPYGTAGPKYYDDQAWIGLALVQYARMTGNRAALSDAERVFNFVYPGGWASRASFEPGGMYWVQQGVGPGRTNHDRTATSTLPNAELALLLAPLNPLQAVQYYTAASQMYQWANHYLYNARSDPTNPDGPNPNFDPGKPPLMFDKVTGRDTVDEKLRTYNQGVMIATDVREYQHTGDRAYLTQATALATTALNTFDQRYYLAGQPAAFNAIFFRGLLILSDVTADQSLRLRIIHTIRTYADAAWIEYRSPSGLFRFPSSTGSGYQLLDQGAMLQIYAALAWRQADWGNLP
jgi:hypothetical protein